MDHVASPVTPAKSLGSTWASFFCFRPAFRFPHLRLRSARYLQATEQVRSATLRHSTKSTYLTLWGKTPLPCASLARIRHWHGILVACPAEVIVHTYRIQGLGMLPAKQPLCICCVQAETASLVPKPNCLVDRRQGIEEGGAATFRRAATTKGTCLSGRCRSHRHCNREDRPQSLLYSSSSVRVSQWCRLGCTETLISCQKVR